MLTPCPYDHQVVAKDSGSPARQSKATVKITVKDVNDNTPKFLKTVYTATVEENTAVGTVIATVEAADDDSEDNGKITYSISNFNGTAVLSPHTPKAVTYHAQSHYCRFMIGHSLGRMNISYFLTTFPFLYEVVLLHMWVLPHTHTHIYIYRNTLERMLNLN